MSNYRVTHGCTLDWARARQYIWDHLGDEEDDALFLDALLEQVDPLRWPDAYAFQAWVNAQEGEWGRALVAKVETEHTYWMLRARNGAPSLN